MATTILGWTLTGFLGLTGTIFFIVLMGFFIYWYFTKSQYFYEVHVREERRGGNTILIKDLGKVFIDEKGVKKLYIKNYKVIWEPPTLDCIEFQARGKQVINLWRDIYGNFHLVKFTSIVPLVIEDDNGDVLTPSIDVKQPNGSIVKIGVKQVIFSPENKSSRFWMVQELRGLWNRHKERNWWDKYGYTATIGIVATVAIFGMLIFGYWITKMMANNASACGEAVSISKQALQSIGSLVGVS